jgi:uncharacterized protein (UPF0548 family)
MLLFRKPKPDTIRRFLDDQGKLDFSYEDIGATASQPPAGYVVDHTRVKLGAGEEVFAAAKAALESWQQFLVAVVARSIGLWWLNACRIVYLIDEELEEKKFGFAYGTLPDHAGAGEERFLIEMDGDGGVWYDILAFSRPNHVLARIGYPYVRRVQKRFGKHSAAAMQQAVESALVIETTG